MFTLACDNMTMRRPGSMYPLGANYDGSGVNFALFARADKVPVCLFDEDDKETHRDDRAELHYVGITSISGIPAGQRHGYRVSGPMRSRQGHAVQPEQAAARPLRQSHRRQHRRRRKPVLLPFRRPGRPNKTTISRSTASPRSWPLAPDWGASQHPGTRHTAVRSSAETRARR